MISQDYGRCVSKEERKRGRMKNEQEEERWWLRVRAFKSFAVSAKFQNPPVFSRFGIEALIS